jgi:3-hydroxyacyl-CoA dehydrogenase
MSNILVVGDGPLAYEIAQLAKTAGHKVEEHLFRLSGEELIDRFEQHPLYEVERYISSATEIIVEAIGGYLFKKAFWEITSSNHRKLAEHLSSTVILACANNSSMASISQSTAYAKARPSTLGWSTLPPIETTHIVELVPSIHTNSASLDVAQQFFTSLGKEPVIIKDCVGGVLPRVVASLINNAAYALMEGVASAADIDAAMKLGTNYPYGPLEWADMIGLDQVLGILEALCEAYGQDRYRPAPILRQLVHAGHWGKRTGQGFYNY